MGGKAVIVEKRDRFSRNNVLHLWPYLIHDLKALGAKKFFGKFCASSIDHVSKWEFHRNSILCDDDLFYVFICYLLVMKFCNRGVLKC